MTYYMTNLLSPHSTSIQFCFLTHVSLCERWIKKPFTVGHSFKKLTSHISIDVYYELWGQTVPIKTLGIVLFNLTGETLLSNQDWWMFLNILSNMSHSIVSTIQLSFRQWLLIVIGHFVLHKRSFRNRWRKRFWTSHFRYV